MRELVKLLQQRQFKQKGFTFVELLVAMVIFSFVIGVSSSIIIQGTKLVNRQIGQANVQNDVKMALALLTKDIQESKEVEEDDPDTNYLFVQTNGNKIGYYYDETRKAIIRKIINQEAVVQEIDFLANITEPEPFNIESSDQKSFLVILNTLNKGDTYGNPEPERHELLVTRRTGRYVSVGDSEISSEKDIVTYGISGQIVITNIDNINRIITLVMPNGTNFTNLIADFLLSPGAVATVNGQVQTSGITANNFSDGLVVYTITANDGSSLNWHVAVNEQNGEGGSGAVLLVDENGEVTSDGFDPVYSVEQPFNVIITSAVGSQTFNDSIVEYTVTNGSITIQSGVDLSTSGTNNGITFTASEDVVLEPGVVLSTDSDGNHNGVSLNSTNGSVILSGADLSSSGNSNFNTININAYLDIDIRDAILEATSEIELTAGRDILAQNAYIISGENVFFSAGRYIYVQDADITSSHNARNIIFVINSNPDGILYVQGVKLRKSPTQSKSAQIDPNNMKICGVISVGSIIGSIYGSTEFTGDWCN